MATTPKKVTPKTSADVLNKIRNMATADYRERIPVAQNKMDSIRRIGQMIMEYEPTMNEFVNAVNLIGKIFVSSRLYNNPWGSLKKGVLEFGETVEELYVNLISSQKFDPDSAWRIVDKKHDVDIRGAFHPLNYERIYPVSVSPDMVKQAFMTMDGVMNLIMKITEQMYTSANVDEFEMMKYMIARNLLDGRFVPVEITPITDKQTAEDFAVINRTNSLNFEFMSDQYNPAGVTTYSDISKQRLIINTKAGSNITTRVLSVAFHDEKADYLSKILYVDSFKSMNNERLEELIGSEPWYVPITDAEKEALDEIPAVLVDEDWFQVYDVLIKMNSRFVEAGDYTNSFLINRKIFSCSPFANAIAYVPTQPKVISITCDPDTYTVNRGQNIVLNPIVETSGFAPKTVTYALDGDVEGVIITPMGEVKVTGSAVPGGFSIKVTSTYDDTVFTDVAVTVV